MSTELEELVGFISHGNTQVRQLAVENLVPYSISHQSIFKANQLLPVKQLNLLVRDYERIAKNAIMILMNLSKDKEILECLVADKDFLKMILNRITNRSETNADLLAMLFANLAKSDSMLSLLTMTGPVPSSLETNALSINQLLDLFVKGASGFYNQDANFNYLSYFFADLAKDAKGRRYLLQKQEYDGVIPLCKLIVFTEHSSDIRRRGVASTIKNVAFEIDAHESLLSEAEVNILPYVLLPIMGNEEYSDEDVDGMLADLQLLSPDKSREGDFGIIKTHVETLMLLTTTRHGRDLLRELKVYPILRETHLHVDNEEVREACERLVQVLMRDEEGEEKVDASMATLSSNVKSQPRISGENGDWAKVQDESDDDDRIVEV